MESVPTNIPFNITTQPAPDVSHGMSGIIPVGPKSATITCPHCRCRIQTEVRYKATTKTHLACLLLSWTCVCCCLPYCMESCQNANHFCPMCSAYIGTYQS